MKLLILNFEYPPLGGGAGNATFYILKELSKNPSFEIDLITSSIDSFRIEAISNNTRIHYLDIGKSANLHYQSWKELLKFSFKSFFYARKLNKRIDFDVCHAFFGIPCGFIAMLLNKPYLISLRGSDVPFYNHRFKLADKLVFKYLSKIIWQRSRFIVANSQGLRALALQTQPGKEIITIANGVNQLEFYPRNRQIVSEKIILISTGRLIERKGYKYLIEALQNNKTYHLKLLGDGNLQEELEQLAQENNVSIEFCGMVEHDKIAENLRNADIFVLPSLNEGMSNSVLEAMACGLPIITTNVGGSYELISENGFIVEKASSKALKEILDLYQKTPALIKEHSIKSRILAKKMDWKAISEEYIKLYLKF